MKDKYIQAIILGVLIGGAILLDDFVGPKDEQKMEKKVLITSGKMPEGLNIDDLTKELHYKIEKGEDIFERGYKLEKVEFDRSFPEYILQNKESLKNWII